jgi:CrcB protein
MLRLIIIVAFGGATGSVARFLATRWVQQHYHHIFPMGTFVVNIIGCLLIGLFYGLSEKQQLLSGEIRLLLTVGFCGGFTTFSTFTADNLALLHDSEFFYTLLYTGLSVIIGIFATYFGNVLAKIM